MTNPSVEKQARDLSYELKNCANEYGFKAEGWELCMGTIAEKEKLEKKYYPIFSAKVVPELLPGVFIKVNETLNLTADMKDKTTPNLNLQYLIAFNPERFR